MTLFPEYTVKEKAKYKTVCERKQKDKITYDCML